MVLDDWGRYRSHPDQVLKQLTSAPRGTAAGYGDHMGGMDMGGMDMSGMGEGMTSKVLGGAGDISYPQFLANGRVPPPHQSR